MKQYSRTWEAGNALDERDACDEPQAVMRAIEALPEYSGAVIVRRAGEPIAAIVPMAGFHLYKRLFDEHEDRLDVGTVEEARREGGPTVPCNQWKAELELESR